MCHVKCGTEPLLKGRKTVPTKLITCFSKHLMNVVRQDPVADPVQGLDQPEFGLHILCLFLLAVNKVQQSLKGKI